MKENKKIKSLRKNKGYTQAKVAEELGVSLSHYKAIENGFRNATLNNAWKISKIFDESIENIFFNQKVH